MYGLAQAYGMVAAGLSRSALVVGADVLSKLMNFDDRSTCVLFGDGAGAVVVERVEDGRLPRVRARRRRVRRAWTCTCRPAARASRRRAESVARGDHNRAHERPRRSSSSRPGARQLCRAACSSAAGLSIEDIDVYVPHQANVRIIDHAVAKLGIPEDRVIVNVDRYGNTSSASIPLALADAIADGSVAQGRYRADDGHGCGLDLGFGGDGMDGGRHEQDCVLLPGPGLARAGHGP